ncbi:MAG: hypothetical protein KIS67_09095 [Verrucomicrobiae bacterium]|nr:hypothetical protein [Verrucomicrobiae bacterium]
MIETAGTAYAMVLSPDGKFYLGGDFTVSQASTRLNLARFNADGTLDTKWLPASVQDGAVLTLALQSDGKLVIGGEFTHVGGLSRSHIARLNSDGSLDLGFDPGFGFDDTVRVVLVQTNGTIFVGGDFNSFDGNVRSRVARLNEDGTLETDFDPNSISGKNPQGRVFSLAVQSDGKIVVGTTYNAYRGTTRDGIYRLSTNGTLDVTFAPPTFGFGSSGEVRDLVVQEDGKIIAVGRFSGYGSEIRSGVARLKTDASLDVTFNPDTDDIFDFYAVEDMEILPNGQVLLVGEGQGDGGRVGIALLNPSGTLDSVFNAGSGFPPYGPAHAVAVQPDGKFLVAGRFLSYADTPVNGVVRMTSDGSIDFPFLESKIRIPGEVYSVSAAGDGKLLVGGLFNHVAGINRTNIVMLNADGTVDTHFVAGGGFTESLQNSSSPSVVTATAVQSDGKVIVGGRYSAYAGGWGFIKRLGPTGTVETNYDLPLPFNPHWDVISLLLQPDGKLLVSTRRSDLDGIYRYNADASLDTNFTGGASANEMVLQADGKIIIGGDFTAVGGTGRNRIARLNSDGTLDTSFDPGSGFNNEVEALVLLGDGKILVGGRFTTFNGAGRNRIARLNPDGSLDTNFTVGSGFNNTVESIHIQMDGRVVAAGPFTAFSGTARRYFARLNTDGSLDQSLTVPSVVPGSGPPSIPVLADAGGGKLLAGGSWLLFDNQVRGGLVLLEPPPPVLLQPPAFAPGNVNLNLSGLAGTTQLVQRAVSVTGPWTNVNQIVIAPDGTGQFHDMDPPVASGYYRTLQQ